MKMYGSYSDEDLNDWQQFPQIASILTSSLFGAWLMRRDENKARQFPTVLLTKIEQAREEVSQHCQGSKDGKCDLCSYCNNLMGVREVLEILDKLMESEDE